MALTQRTKIQIVCQYVLLLSFFLIIVFATMGRFSMELPIMYFMDIREPDSSFSNEINTELASGTFGCFEIGAFTILESIMLIINKKATYVIGIITCLFRQISPLFLVLLDVFALIINDDAVTVDLTVFPYLLLTIGIISFVNYLNIKKQTRVLVNSQNEQQEME